MAHPATYTAYRWEQPNAPLTKTQLPFPSPQEGEVVIKVLACGLCATDHIIHAGALPSGFPRVPGHEVVGDIVAAHHNVKNFKVGQRVGAPWQRGFCGTCRSCVAGKPMGCVELGRFSTGCAADGGLAQYLLVPTTGICPVPNDMDPAEVAPLLCAGLTVYKAMTHVNVPAGSLVAVHGVGGLGHLAVQYSKALGYRTVAISSSSLKKDLSLSLGAEVYIDESTQDVVQELLKLGGADMIVSTAPTSAGAWKLLDGLAFEGTLVPVSLPTDTAPLSPVALNSKRLSIQGYLVGDVNDCAETIEFSRKHGIKVLAEKFPLDKAEDAYAHLPNARFRCVVLPWA